MTKDEQQTEALQRATQGDSIKNDQLVIEGFEAKGIFDAEPRRNCFSYNAWQKLGRQVVKRPKDVEKGAYGVAIPTWIRCTKKDSDETYTRPKMVTIFHISQTEAKTA